MTQRYWLNTIGVSILICLLGLAELMVRRQTGANLYLLNKSLASTAFLMITGSFVWSAIHHYAKLPQNWLPYRRYLGLTGYGYGVIHIIVGFFARDPEQPGALKFPFPDFILDHPLSYLFGIPGFVIFTHFAIRSIRPRQPQKGISHRKPPGLSPFYGYIGVLLIFLHSTLLKYEGWLTWIETRSPWLPPLSLIVASLVIGMACIKLIHVRSRKDYPKTKKEKRRAEEITS